MTIPLAVYMPGRAMFLCDFSTARPAYIGTLYGVFETETHDYMLAQNQFFIAKNYCTTVKIRVQTIELHILFVKCKLKTSVRLVSQLVS